MTRSLRRIAIVNRGEAAMRCIRAVKALRAEEDSDLSSIALYTSVDWNSPFVRHADRAVALPRRKSAVAAYLDHDLLLDVLRNCEADAVWPGWGFVAEDAAFVEGLRKAGITFLGPSPEAMRALGDKIAAKELAESLGVPVTPWSGGALADPDAARIAADKLGYPLALKASAGGGGRGIRMIDSAATIVEDFRAARSEALSAFGDGRLFLERKVSGGRHVEVQIAADRHGNARALGLRDCSVQRRHQKVVEEAPAPGLAPGLETSLREWSEEVSKRVGYEGVGTVEFLVRGEEAYFLEMNPRLQVEHGITEAITGLDLVQLQIRIARGESIADLEVREEGAAIEVRLCAEDPDNDFAPAPGRVARFEPALGPGIRVDLGIVAGCDVPPDFDSLVAKIIARAATRHAAMARLVAALTDTDVHIEGGATNKAFLLDVLRSEDLRRGPVDTTWLDRFMKTRPTTPALAVEALVAAAILSYQRQRATARANFFADVSNLAPERIPPSQGQEIDLTYAAQSYKLTVFATGGWSYRVRLDDDVLLVTLREDGAHSARLQIGERTLRVLHDVGESGLRIEIEGRVHRFGSSSAGTVQAAAPAMVVALHVSEGETVAAGQSLGVLEAMKMEIGFRAPIAGRVESIAARAGQQVAAGETILVIEAEADGAAAPTGTRLELPGSPDPLAPLFQRDAEGRECVVDLSEIDRLDSQARRSLFLAIRAEVRRVLLGYDADPARTEQLIAFLEAPLPEALTPALRRRLVEIRHELTVLADVDELFFTEAPTAAAGTREPSNDARFRMYVRRMRAAGTGVAEAFLAKLRRVLGHYGVTTLEHHDALERAVLRILASQQTPELRNRLARAILLRVQSLARHGVGLSSDSWLRRALARLVSLRGHVADSVSDAALDTTFDVFDRPEIEARADRTRNAVDQWLEGDGAAATPSERVLREVSSAPTEIFDRLRPWLTSDDARQRSLAITSALLRLYAGREVAEREASPTEGTSAAFRFRDDARVFAAACHASEVGEVVRQLVAEAESRGGALAIEIALLDAEADPSDAIRSALGETKAVRRVSWACNATVEEGRYETLEAGEAGFASRPDLLGLHPEVAERIAFHRLSSFEIERHSSRGDVYCFLGRSRAVPGDERIFVLADARPTADPSPLEATSYLPTFERLFHESAHAVRNLIAHLDPTRRLHWNRIAIFVAPSVYFDPRISMPLAMRLASATNNLGLEKVVVRLRVLNRDQPKARPEVYELEIADRTGANLEIVWREPHDAPLEPATDYERSVVAARRRNVVYPYEIVRMLSGESRTRAEELFPAGSFTEYDLDPQHDTPTGVPVDRPPGKNQAAVVFGIIDTPTAEVPEGMRRVLLLSDPTKGLGALAKPECDRIEAALRLAESESLPLEWVPVSSGAKIAMDSGTENLDATARVVRRIVEFTQAGGSIHLIVLGVNVGAQSYFDALSTMLLHTRGALIMTPGGSMVLTGRAALAASGAVSAEDEVSIGGFERIMGPNGQAQYFAADLVDAYRVLYEHYRYTYVVPGEARPRAAETTDPMERSIVDAPCGEEGFATVGEIFDTQTNPGRKRAFPMRPVMAAVVDSDGGHLERWQPMVGAETAIVWDARIGGEAVCLIGIESRSVGREGYHPPDGPPAWSGGTLFPLSSKKVARALNAASGNRPVVVLANLSGFDGSPESMRKLQLEYGAEIARAVVNFRGPICFVVVSRYHGGAYVVFSQELNDGLRSAALEGSYASVIGGGPAAAVVFPRVVRQRALADPRVTELEAASKRDPSAELRARLERTLAEVTLEKQAEVAREFDGVHTVERAKEVGSITDLFPARDLRAYLARRVRRLP